MICCNNVHIFHTTLTKRIVIYACDFEWQIILYCRTTCTHIWYIYRIITGNFIFHIRINQYIYKERSNFPHTRIIDKFWFRIFTILLLLWHKNLDAINMEIHENTSTNIHHLYLPLSLICAKQLHSQQLTKMEPNIRQSTWFSQNDS